MAYFCTDDRTESFAITRHWLVFTYRTSLHGNTRAITPPRPTGNDHAYRTGRPDGEKRNANPPQRRSEHD